eukprot:jgi/Bigna1/69111/fgenesh1_pg.8_\
MGGDPKKNMEQETNKAAKAAGIDSRMMEAMIGNMDKQLDATIGKVSGGTNGVPESVLSGSTSSFQNPSLPQHVQLTQQGKGVVVANTVKSLHALPGGPNDKDAALGIPTPTGFLDLVESRLTPKQETYKQLLMRYMEMAKMAARKAEGLIVGTKTELAALVQRLRKEKTELLQWLHKEEQNALHKIESQEALTDTIKSQIEYLQKAYNQAMSKADTYLKQIQHIEVQRRLQTTPPFNEAVTKISLSEEQYMDSLTELNHWREAAIEIAKQAKEGYQRREVAIQELTQWCKASRQRLDAWIHHQQIQITQKLLAGKAAVDHMKRELDGLKHIIEDAKEHEEIYNTSLERLRVSGKVGTLEAVLGASMQQEALIQARAHTLKSTTTEVKRRLDALTEHLANLGGPIAQSPRPPPAEWGQYLTSLPVPVVDPHLQAAGAVVAAKGVRPVRAVAAALPHPAVLHHPLPHPPALAHAVAGQKQATAFPPVPTLDDDFGADDLDG